MKKKPTGKSEIRFRHRLFFSPEYKSLSSSAKVLYTHLRVCHSWLCHSDPSLPISQSDRELSADTGLSERAITSAKKLLNGGGWIRVENGVMATPAKHAQASKYWILVFDLPDICGVNASPLCRVFNVPLSGDAMYRNERPTFGGHNVVKTLTDAEDICRMFGEDPDPVDDEGRWPF